MVISRPGLLTTVQDLGRWGWQSRGVPVSGAMDAFSHRLANRMVGNADNLATLEATLTGPELTFDRDAVCAVAGAEFALSVDGAAVGMNRAIEVKSGSTLLFGERRRGARAYVAVAGGFDVPEVLGSRSTHTLTRMGGYEGRALKRGDRIRIGVRGDGQGAKVIAPRSLPLTPFHHLAALRMIASDARLAAHVLLQGFRVSPHSNRMGYRLEGETHETAAPGELISGAVATGSIQVPPDGRPILLMNDHATTGGYAIAGTVITADLPHAGQLAPGDSVQFVECSLAEADEALRLQEAHLGVA